VPIFVPAGEHTTVSFNGQTAPVQAYAIYRGDCNLFQSSTNPRIANNYGQDCHGARAPLSSASSYRVNGKLNYSYGTGSKLAVTILGNQNQGRVFDYGNMFNTGAQYGTRGWSRAFIANWTQNLSKSAERALALDAYFSYQLDRFIQSPFGLGTTGPGSGTAGFYVKPYKFLYDFDSFPLDSQLVNNFRTVSGVRSPTGFDERLQYTDQILNNPYGERTNDYNTFSSASAFVTAGFAEAGLAQTRLFMQRENRTLGKVNLDWQLDRYNRVRAGGEATKYHIENLQTSLVTEIFGDAYIENPLRWAGYLEDRLDLGDLVLVGGLRYDWYDSRAGHPVFVCDATQDAADGKADGLCGDELAVGDTTFTPRIASNPAFDPTNPTKFYLRDQKHHYLSPHVQVSFPVTDRTNFRLSYAHQVESPDFALIYTGINTDLSSTNTNQSYGSDLGFGKTITFEFGIRHAFSDDMVLDLAAYNKDNLSNPTVRLIRTYDPNRRQSGDIRYVTNLDFGNTRGVDVRLDRRFGNIFNGTLSYSFQQAKNTGSDPFTYNAFGARIINAVSGANQPPPQAIIPVSSSRPQTLGGAFSATFPADFKQGTAAGAILGNFGIYATFQYASGTAYTRCEQAGNEQVISGTVCTRGNYVGGLNTARLPAYKALDMRFTKGFNVAGVNLLAYLDARNILNLRNVLAVYVTTNDVTSSVERARYFQADSSRLAAQAAASGVYQPDGTVDLTFGGARASGCGAFTTESGDQALTAVQDCVYLVRAEERWGNGDGLFTLDEQRRSFGAVYDVYRGDNNFVGAGRRMRLGLELNF
jgi:hypothetical protein